MNPTQAHPAFAEFDLLAQQYHAQHQANVAITGEAPEYFAEYKVTDLAAFVRTTGKPAEAILDFGSGIGNSIPFFRKYFPTSHLCCADVSTRSIEMAQARFPGRERHVHVTGTLPLPDSSQDIVFSACVFHHIPPAEHAHWLAELRRVTRPGGVLVIYEHNPFNPLTVYAVKTCPLDANANLIRAGVMARRMVLAGWTEHRLDYKLFFTAALSRLRSLERRLGWLCLGAQYRAVAVKPA